jgi:hypothetical protein
VKTTLLLFDSGITGVTTISGVFSAGVKLGVNNFPAGEDVFAASIRGGISRAFTDFFDDRRTENRPQTTIELAIRMKKIADRLLFIFSLQYMAADAQPKVNIAIRHNPIKILHFACLKN